MTNHTTRTPIAVSMSLPNSHEGDRRRERLPARRSRCESASGSCLSSRFHRSPDCPNYSITRFTR